MMNKLRSTPSIYLTTHNNNALKWVQTKLWTSWSMREGPREQPAASQENCWSTKVGSAGSWHKDHLVHMRRIRWVMGKGPASLQMKDWLVHEKIAGQWLSEQVLERGTSWSSREGPAGPREKDLLVPDRRTSWSTNEKRCSWSTKDGPAGLSW